MCVADIARALGKWPEPDWDWEMILCWHVECVRYSKAEQEAIEEVSQQGKTEPMGLLDKIDLPVTT